MTARARFEVDIPADAMQAFAGLSGDWNALHTDPAYAAGTVYGACVLHGAYSAGLVSRMAGMHLPGEACLLHGIQLRFNSPIIPPVRVVVDGTTIRDNGEHGRVEVAISDAVSGARYVDASYDFGRHLRAGERPDVVTPVASSADVVPRVLVTGARGALGRQVLNALGARGLGVSRTVYPGMLHAPDPDAIDDLTEGQQIDAIVHCAWPRPDSGRLLSSREAGAAVDHHVAGPLRQMLALARLLARVGTPGAMLVLIGSTAMDPGRHNYRMPLYTLGKSLVPQLARILAVELASTGQRCAAIVYDVLDGGMNEGLTPRARLAHQDRLPSGRIPTVEDAADQIVWLLGNRSVLVSGATIELTAGAIP
jgi:acyl dehydratase